MINDDNPYYYYGILYVNSTKPLSLYKSDNIYKIIFGFLPS